MTLKQKDKLRRLIAEKKDGIRKRYAEHLGVLTELSVRTIGDAADEAVREDEIDLQFAFEESDLEELRRLDIAESRLDREDFGICQSCGEVIEMKRLLAVPETTLCYDCAVEAGRGNRDERIHIAAPLSVTSRW